MKAILVLLLLTVAGCGSDICEGKSAGTYTCESHCGSYSCDSECREC